MEDRRKFTRIFFSTPAQLSFEKQTWDVELIDLSLNGALISQPQNQPKLTINASDYELSFVLPSSEILIQMTVQLAHIESSKIGLRISHLDVESAGHIKRIVELNMANSEELYRELEMLSYPK